MDLSSKSLKTFALEKLRGKWWLAVAVSFVATLLGAHGGGSSGGSGGDGSSGYVTNIDRFIGALPSSVVVALLTLLGLMAIWAVAAFIIGPVISVGEKDFYTKLCKDEPVTFSTLFSKMSIFLKSWGLNFMMVLFIVLWMLLLVIPGIIAALRYSMAKYIMAENTDAGVFEAINKSKEMMKGHKMELFVLYLSFIGWAILSLFTFGIGFLFLAPYVRASEAAFYLRVSRDGAAI